jgi:hypothetical protein
LDSGGITSTLMGLYPHLAQSQIAEANDLIAQAAGLPTG